MANNVYKEARLKAAKKDARFKSVASACRGKLRIDRSRLLKIEKDDSKKESILPYPEEVVELARAYDAPELCDYFCTHSCPIGKEKNEEPLMHDDLAKISTRLLASLYFLQNAQNEIHSVLADSEITYNEQEKLKRIIDILHNIAYSASSLELWAEKNNLIDN